MVDATFDLRHPEILVYNKRADGSFYLPAVEYAVPLDLAATAPEGFSGSTDNEVFVNANDEKKFYIRRQASTAELKSLELYEYLKAREY